MGMFDKWFGGKNDYPPLPADNEAMAKLDEVKHIMQLDSSKESAGARMVKVGKVALQLARRSRQVPNTSLLNSWSKNTE